MPRGIHLRRKLSPAGNRLGRETSPYLLSHANNPVDWYPWCEEALERARAEDRPILLSIGYAACHWCHVMERESFEDEGIARVMNAHFVCIKVDREERPDLDDIYMAATVAMNGSGGWPMTVFLTPEQRPFFAGTYFPPEDKYGRPGFRSLLDRMAELWRDKREAVSEQAEELTALVAQQSMRSASAPVHDRAMGAAVLALGDAFDPEYGGFSRAPKFPPAATLSLLLCHHHHTGDEHALTMARRTLDAMKDGGIYDHLGGGFARYATDERWLVPHFEKMLYDNAQLARVFLEAFQVTADPEYSRVAAETLDYVLREMQGQHGGYFSATDADSEGVEGKFFVWSKAEVAEVLDDEAATAHFCAHYDVSDDGNWEGHNVLNTPRPLEEIADALSLDAKALRTSLESSKAKLYAKRAERVPPLLDDKVLVSWNALMISAMSDGARVLGDARYLRSAERAAEYLFAELVRPDGGLFRTAREGQSHLDAYLEDYAMLCDALVDLYEAGGAAVWLSRAESLADRLVADFGDEEAHHAGVSGAFFHTAKQHESLILRTREGHDGAMPNPNGVAARALARLAVHRQRDDLRVRAQEAVRAYGREIAEMPRAFTTTLSAADFLMRGPVELAVVGPPGDEKTLAIWREIARHHLPNRVVAHGDDDTHPMLAGKAQVDGQPALYVCRDFACQAPVCDPAQIGDMLRGAERAARATRATALRGVGPVRATAEATLAWAERHARLGPHAFAELGSTGLSISRVGFGAQRVSGENAEHREALLAALTGGINLIDTAAHFVGGASERLIGDVLREARQRGDVHRNAVVVVSKLGYVAGTDLRHLRRLTSHGRAIPGVLELAEGHAWCAAPEWLAEQLPRSLSRLGLDALDVCLLHAPEQLQDAEFHAALVRTFAFFEEQVAQGHIGVYGASTERGEALEPLLAAAREAGGEYHHFAVIELPLNVLETRAGAAIRWAEREGLAVLAQRPLNALVMSKNDSEGSDPPELLRLADAKAPGGAPPLPDSLRAMAAREDEYRSTFGPVLRAQPGANVDPSRFFDWQPALTSLAKQRATLAQIEEIATELVGPQIEAQLGMIDQAMRGPLAPRWTEWRARYMPSVSAVVRALLHRAYGETEARLVPIRAAIDAALPEARRGEPLARKALWVAASQPGVTSVLCGLRQPDYVRDAVAVLGWPPLETPPRIE